MELNKKNVLKILGIISFGVALFCILQRFEAVVGVLRGALALISPILIGLALAFILNVPMSFIERSFFGNKKGKRWVNAIKRPVSLVITIVLILAIVALVMLLVIPELANTVIVLSEIFPGFLNNLIVWAQSVAGNVPGMEEWLKGVEHISIDWQQITSTVWDFLRNGGGSLLMNTFNAATTIFNGIVNAFLSIVFACYVLVQKEMLAKQCKRLLYAFLPPRITDRILFVCRLSGRTFANFLSGQCMEAVILGTLCFIGMSVFRFPYALMISVLIGVLSIIPMFGALIGVVLGVFIILMVSPMQALWFLVFYVVLQQVEGNVIYPRVVGGSVGLPAVWVLFAVTVGAGFWGLPGILINIPLCSVIYSLLGETVFKRLKNRIRSGKLTVRQIRAKR